jgi:hypothetical protein
MRQIIKKSTPGTASCRTMTGVWGAFRGGLFEWCCRMNAAFRPDLTASLIMDCGGKLRARRRFVGRTQR